MTAGALSFPHSCFKTTAICLPKESQMKKLFLIIILHTCVAVRVNSQSFTIDDLVTLSTLSQKNIDHFMRKNGFILSVNQRGDKIQYLQKIKGKKKDIIPECVEIYTIDNSEYFSFRTFSMNEYQEGQRRIIKKGFFYDDKLDITREPSVLYQKRNISIQAMSGMKDSIPQYTFVLEEKRVPATIGYAEELLQFNSHEFLTSFFGEQNVKKDLYYFSEKELKKCSVLFSGTSKQAVFVWGDENNFKDLTYILVSNVIPTAGAKEHNNEVIGNNEWQFQNGVHPGMTVKELLQLNEMDFEIYGNTSDLSFMVKPGERGKINFKKTAIMLSCDNCNSNKMFNQQLVNALDVAKKNLPMYVYDVIIYPPGHH